MQNTKHERVFTHITVQTFPHGSIKQADSAPVYGNISVMAGTADPANTETGDDVDIEYASLQFRVSEEQGKHGRSAVDTLGNSPRGGRR